MGNNSSNTGGGMGLGTILFLIFLVLKLTNYIDWSWWWVTAPLWITAILYIVIVTIFIKFFQRRRGRRR
jgi:phosphotransferase system  glucose/maltose/N-acetylglucosamine-specific IIC component